MRYSIIGREHGSNHDVELAQCENNPRPIYEALLAKTLTIKSELAGKRRRTKIAKYSYLRIVDHGARGDA
jgi:hypothetical protein